MNKVIQNLVESLTLLSVNLEKEIGKTCLHVIQMQSSHICGAMLTIPYQKSMSSRVRDLKVSKSLQLLSLNVVILVHLVMKMAKFKSSTYRVELTVDYFHLNNQRLHMDSI